MLKENSRLFENLFLALELAIVSLSWLFAFYLRFHSGLIPVYHDVPPFDTYFFFLLPIVIIWGIIFKSSRMYHSRRIASKQKEYQELLKATTISILLFLALSFFLKGHEISRLMLVIFAVTSTTALAIERTAVRSLLGLIRKRGYNLRKALIVGSGEAANEVFEKLKAHPETGITVLGFIFDKNEGSQGEAGARHLGNYDEIKGIIKYDGVDFIIVTNGLKQHGGLFDILEELGDEPVKVKVIPKIDELIAFGAAAETFDGIPIISLQDSPIYGLDAAIKRVLDVAVSSTCIVLASPLMILIAILIKATSPGPVFYRQERATCEGGSFTMLKFRSMKVNAEEKTGPVWAKSDDQRCTPMGAFLRRTNLDEVPQLFNVLNGEMSLVGPRPERAVFIKKFKASMPNYMLRHKVKGGMTGWAQINGWRGDTSIAKRIEHDLYYTENWSIFLDLKILWLTLLEGLNQKTTC